MIKACNASAITNLKGRLFLSTLAKSVAMNLSKLTKQEKLDEMVKSLSPHEIVALERSLAKLPLKTLGSESFLRSEMARADTDNDGVLSSEEFRKWVNSRAWSRALLTNSNSEGSQLSNDDSEEPSNEQLAKLSVRTATPFFAFGLVDNFIMVTAGAAIEDTVGISLGLSTMVSAGFGNMFADGLGIGLTKWIESGADKLGLPNPNLMENQKKTRKVKIVAAVSGFLGISLGYNKSIKLKLSKMIIFFSRCVVGMFPLLL